MRARQQLPINANLSDLHTTPPCRRSRRQYSANKKSRLPVDCSIRPSFGSSRAARIAEGQFYEAHQQLRVIAARYVKQSNWNAAIDILSQGAQALLQAGQGGSGGDLCNFLIEVYHKAETKPDAGSKARVLSLLRAFPPDEPTKKRFIGELIA